MARNNEVRRIRLDPNLALRTGGEISVLDNGQVEIAIPITFIDFKEIEKALDAGEVSELAKSVGMAALVRAINNIGTAEFISKATV